MVPHVPWVSGQNKQGQRGPVGIFQRKNQSQTQKDAPLLHNYGKYQATQVDSYDQMLWNNPIKRQQHGWGRIHGLKGGIKKKF